MTGKRTPVWTDEENAILREHYPNGGAYALEGKLDRSRKAIMEHAIKLGIRVNKVRYEIKKVAAVPRWQDKKKPTNVESEPVITGKTRVTICPGGRDMRYAVDHAPSVVDARQCRPWALNIGS